MSELNLNKVHPVAGERARPFLEEIVSGSPGEMRSIYITGSAVTPDFNVKTSDVNSLLILSDIEVQFLDFLADLGRKYAKRGVAAPLLMTPGYIERSLDVFPVEFLDLQLVSQLVVGEELLQDRKIDHGNMRLQCERELKGRLITLRQGYIRALGDRQLLRDLLVGSLAGLIPLARGILFAMREETPVDRAAVFSRLQQRTGVDMAPADAIIRVKGERRKPSVKDLCSLFSGYYETIGKLADAVDATA